mmetsp:Transcript_35770/g.88059  ORF Transcript_35770/g.88059 Transcript_35770/m.88059 type:complete len:240 (+) Transcript_35770:155-874(+)
MAVWHGRHTAATSNKLRPVGQKPRFWKCLCCESGNRWWRVSGVTRSHISHWLRDRQSSASSSLAMARAMAARRSPYRPPLPSPSSPPPASPPPPASSSSSPASSSSSSSSSGDNSHENIMLSNRSRAAAASSGTPSSSTSARMLSAATSSISSSGSLTRFRRHLETAARIRASVSSLRAESPSSRAAVGTPKSSPTSSTSPSGLPMFIILFAQRSSGWRERGCMGGEVRRRCNLPWYKG